MRRGGALLATPRASRPLSLIDLPLQSVTAFLGLRDLIKFVLMGSRELKAEVVVEGGNGRSVVVAYTFFCRFFWVVSGFEYILFNSVGCFGTSVLRSSSFHV